MPFANDSGDGGWRAPSDGDTTNAHLVEALIHLLIEKGVLTRNDALSLIQTVAQVRLGRLAEVEGSEPPFDGELERLRRLYGSFEALDARPGVVYADGGNVRRLRPPLHGDRPEFPRSE